MSDHANEPLFYQESADPYTHIIRSKVNPGMIVCYLPQSRSEKTKATARRIAACWNACAGVSTEMLERERIARFVNERDDFKQHRDALLAALQELADRVERIALDDESTPDTSRARAEIAKALGDQS